MWILESNDDFLQGKRMWLKPGQKYLFGRVKREGVQFAIDHKTVSRKHFIIIVDPVKEGDAAHIHARTRISIEDQKSKSGTSVNGEIIKGVSKELKSAENSIRPGTCPHEIIIRWQPCVLTFNLLKKEIKAGVLKTKQTRVQNLDIKAISDFVLEYTTHVVANKRNTAKGLLALVTGKYLVADSFIDALEYAATPTNLSQEENLSLLESDFDSAWPDAKTHLPPPGREPTIRPPEAYQPDTSRSTVFEGYTFVFGDQTQYDNLLPVITSGHGKALLFKVSNGESTADDLLDFLQKAAGRKHTGGTRNWADARIILVRWQGKDDLQDWTNALINQAALQMDQRAIDQSEFLEAILANDASLLQQSIPFESTTDGRVAPPPSAANTVVTQPRTESAEIGEQRRSSLRAEAAPSEAAPSQTSRVDSVPKSGPSQVSSVAASQASNAQQSITRPFQGPRFTQGSRFKNFDDDFDPDAVVEYNDDEQVADDSESGADTTGRTPLSSIKEEPQSAKKRRRTPSEEPEDAFAEEIDNLLPAATAFKRRKLAEARINGNVDVDDVSNRNVPRKAAAAAAAAKKVKKEREIDVREIARAQREQNEEAARREEEELESAPPFIEETGPANLVTVVAMELPVRNKRKQTVGTDGDPSENWDPRWNGRKNFKAFRRKGEAPQRRGHAKKVIVPLVEVKGNTYGLGEQYWEKTQEEKEQERERKKKEGARSQRTQSQTQRTNASRQSRTTVVSDSEDDDGFDGGVDHPVSTSPGMTRLQREAAEIMDHEIDPDTPRRTRAADRSQASNTTAHSGSGAATAASGNSNSTSMPGKRAGSSITSSARDNKRQKTLPVTVLRAKDSDENDSDDLKFRFGAKARRGRAGRGRGQQ
ncbi:hypothetical protein HRR83_003401 [Exophiala dermatitidis]|uniref:FHA domain-containing protein n=2 Tax=Exophiala dermatitidis TaxID=5970 RepID=H6BMF8_EXODN|nr:uncharacterized protein HMPREF1120_00259 [Exophiala dermatitidis NIH/UT8656]KAJ4514702.1 hypothetical protein HRR75_004066 [Exophiala dermatitidis]EHY52040.1 hypothetical protein HMPREF1120_00259 [Exophiala dermatitidis NIH/UT8656]KAJ4518145.1 hypothetical protein HRR74_004440 [Exophiala dermatitidis]KAJ4521043.1 hypothetical protein HRR73_003384 [Exophiala dermatitidis]KAJ4547626.1 hypothetical protein HRR76_000258 [Exophiala dermatitidis]